MKGNVLNYLNAVIPGLPAEIVSADAHRKLLNMAELFSGFAASEYILESRLNSEDAGFDFSFRVLAEERDSLSRGCKDSAFTVPARDEIWRRIINFTNYWQEDIDDIWLEFDYHEFAREIPQPCFFFNASRIKKGKDINVYLLGESLKQLLPQEQVQLLWLRLQGAINQLPPEAGLFQVGTMLARNRDRVRVFTAELNRQQAEDYLPAAGWKGSYAQLDEIFNLVHEYSDGQYILDFDVAEEGISPKLGINFGLVNRAALPAFLDDLVLHRLCAESKKNGVLAWTGSQGTFLGPDYGFTALIKDISHFKVSCSPQEGINVKAYLRFSGIYFKQLFAARKSDISLSEVTDATI